MCHDSDGKSEAIARTLALKDWPARDRSGDKRDHAAAILAFPAVARGEVVADFLPFRGYYTRLFANSEDRHGLSVFAHPVHYSEDQFIYRFRKPEGRA